MVKQKEKKTTPEYTGVREDKGKDIGVIILNLFLAIATILLLGYIAYRNGYINLDNILNTQETETTDEGEEEEMIEIPENGEDPLVLETFEGQYFSAVVPVGWQVVEFVDGDGSEMLDDGGTYTGLTGIQILYGGTTVIKLEAVSGIGFVGCRELPRFEDSSTEYEEMQQELNVEIDEDAVIEFLDYTDVPYSEYHLFGKRFRRIGAALYYDTTEDDEFFQPQCEVSFIRMNDIDFLIDGVQTGDTYMYTISQDITNEKLTILDQILTSMTAR